MAINRWTAAVLTSVIPVVMALAWRCGPGGEPMEQMRRTEAEGDAPPEGYLSVEDFVAERHREFPALHEAPPPAPIESSGRLVEVYRYWPAGTDADSSVRALALRLERSPGPALRAYLDLPVKPELLEHLRSLSRRDSVTVSGIGHGSGTGVINIYPVHRFDGREP